VSNDSAGNEEKGIWNGGITNKYNKMLRESEDYYDVVDSEREFRKDLVKREKLMKEQEQKNPIRSKFGAYNQDIKNQINKNMDKPCEISGGDPKNRYRSPEGIKVGNKFQGVKNDNNE